MLTNKYQNKNKFYKCQVNINNNNKNVGIGQKNPTII